MARLNARGEPEGEETDVDARPSDAINFAIRAGVSVLLCVCRQTDTSVQKHVCVF